MRSDAYCGGIAGTDACGKPDPAQHRAGHGETGHRGYRVLQGCDGV
jgi:hypothetical protein